MRALPSERWFLGGVMLFIVATRALVHPRYFVEWDEVNFALALRHFDVTQHQPHPPGFPLFVLAAWPFYRMGASEKAAFTLVSALSSALAVPFLYALGRRWFDRSTAALWVAWWATQPLLWFYGALPLSYTAEGLVVCFLAWLWSHASQERPLPSWLWGGIFGLAGGVRPSTYMMLGLPWLASMSRLPKRQWPAVMLAFLSGAILWIAPTAWLSGGWRAYSEEVRWYGMGFFGHASLLTGHWQEGWPHIQRLGEILWELWGPGFVLLPLGLLSWWPALKASSWPHRFLALWLLGGMLYLMGFHMGQPGYLIALLPPLGFAFLSLFRKALEPWGRLRPFWRWEGGGALAVGLLLCFWNGLVFLWGKGSFTVFHLQHLEHDWEMRQALLRSHFPPERTWVLSFSDFRRAAWYLPEYHVWLISLLFRDPKAFPLRCQNVYHAFQGNTEPKRWWYPSEYRPTPLALPEGVRFLVLLDEELTWVYQGEMPLRPLPKEGPRLWWLEVPPGARLTYAFGSWRLEVEEDHGKPPPSDGP